MSETKIVINPETQILTLFVKEEYSNWNSPEWKPFDSYIISTAKNGLGVESGSGKTPTGNFEVVEKYGDGAEKGSVFVGRRENGQVWTPDPENPLNQGENATKGFVLTRILRLGGLDEDNKNTFDRYIYIHATRNTHMLGQPYSAGCITSNHDDVIDIFNKVALGSKVEILNREFNSVSAKVEQEKVKKIKLASSTSLQNYPNIF